MKRIVVLGASGSIGQQTIDVISHHPDYFTLVAFSVGKNVAVAEEIIKNHLPKLVAVGSEADKEKLQRKFPEIEIVAGPEGLEVLAKLADYDILLNALVGFVGLNPTLTAINKGKDIALANKECLVVAGEFVMEACCRNNVRLLPVDSEHSAIFQALQGNDYKKIKRIILTASGGSFRDYSRDMLQHVSKEETLQHPNWQMGAKITVDSATMMNKGFEVIEAHWLFGIDYDDIEVVMHRESIVHSLVEYIDNSIIAQMGIPDMRLPIQYALSYPQRLPLPQVEGYDFKNRISLSFEPIDFQRYPLLGLAYEVGQKKGNLPAIMNAANEEAVAAFLNDQISFLEIEEYVISACRELDYQKDVILNDVFTADQKARKYVRERIKGD